VAVDPQRDLWIGVAQLPEDIGDQVALIWVRIGCRKCSFLPRLAASRQVRTCNFNGFNTRSVTRTQEVEGSNPFVSTKLSMT